MLDILHHSDVFPTFTKLHPIIVYTVSWPNIFSDFALIRVSEQTSLQHLWYFS